MSNEQTGVPQQSDEHGEEARRRWGETDAYRESARRTKEYGPAEWARIREESEALEARLAELMAAGRAPEDEESKAAADGLRLHIDRWFYPCSPAMHVALAEMYVADPRFRAHYEERAEGLAEYVAAAIRANAAG